MLPLHIKLELMKNFVKAMAKNCLNGFLFSFKIFPKLSQAKLREGIFVGLQLWKGFKVREFKKALNRLELQAWQAAFVKATYIGQTVFSRSSKNMLFQGF